MRQCFRLLGAVAAYVKYFKFVRRRFSSSNFNVSTRAQVLDSSARYPHYSWPSFIGNGSSTPRLYTQPTITRSSDIGNARILARQRWKPSDLCHYNYMNGCTTASPCRSPAPSSTSSHSSLMPPHRVSPSFLFFLLLLLDSPFVFFLLQFSSWWTTRPRSPLWVLGRWRGLGC